MPNIRHELIIGAPAETVYSAITTKQGLSAWWTPETSSQPGNVFRFGFGTEYYKEMKVTTTEPNTLVTWNCIQGFHEWIDTTITFSLHPGNRQSLLEAHPEAAGQIEQQQNDGEIVLLKFAHDNWRDDTPMYAECNYTWGQFLRSLKLFCETRKGKPWPDQHAS